PLHTIKTQKIPWSDAINASVSDTDTKGRSRHCTRALTSVFCSKRRITPCVSMNIRSICVYCGSSPGARPAYVEQATAFGAALAQRGISVVYGGASIGLMGAVADAALAAKG